MDCIRTRLLHTPDILSASAAARYTHPSHSGPCPIAAAPQSPSPSTSVVGYADVAGTPPVPLALFYVAELRALRGWMT